MFGIMDAFGRDILRPPQGSKRGKSQQAGYILFGTKKKVCVDV
jgi:hypothetical protein